MKTTIDLPKKDHWSINEADNSKKIIEVGSRNSGFFTKGSNFVQNKLDEQYTYLVLSFA